MGTYTRRMSNNNLEIRIAGSSCFARNNDKNDLITPAYYKILEWMKIEHSVLLGGLTN